MIYLNTQQVAHAINGATHPKRRLFKRRYDPVQRSNVNDLGYKLDTNYGIQPEHTIRQRTMDRHQAKPNATQPEAQNQATKLQGGCSNQSSDRKIERAQE